MTRQEYMEELKKYLKRLPKEDYDNAIEYFSEYFDEAGPEYEQQVMEELQKSGADMIVLAGYMKVLPKEIIERYRNKIINIHPSLIPKYCGKGFYGKRVHKAVLEGGEKESGATVHFVDEGVDTGEIILQEKVPVLEGDTPDELAARVLKVEHRILAEGLNQIAAKIQVEKMKSDEKGGKR